MHPLEEFYSKFTVHVKVYQLQGAELKLVKEVEKPSSFKCGTFGASTLSERQLATGNFVGKLQIWDIESTGQPLFDVQAHASIVNALDGCGGQVGPASHLQIFDCLSAWFKLYRR